MTSKARKAEGGDEERPREIVVYGAGGMGREVRWLAEDCGHTVRCYVDDHATAGQVLGGLDVLLPETARERFPDAAVALAIGSSQRRGASAVLARSLGFALATLVHPGVVRSAEVRIGEGSVICAGTILTTDVVIDENVQVNIGCTISHDVTLKAGATLAPGVHISGAVHVGRRVHLGTGAVVINGTIDEPITLGDDAIVGAGACVTRSVAPGTTVVGVPARPIAP